jgi:hypothetical protein
LKNYDYSKRFLKKALEYVWFENKSDSEVTIYDKLGMIFYLEGDIQKAKEFHERYCIDYIILRSIYYLLEEDSSPTKRHSIDALRK